MRIGIIHSGYEMLPIFQLLGRHDHEWHMFCDWAYGPWGDKSPTLRAERIQVGIAYLQDKVDVLIVPPLTELQLQDTEQQIPILPLFETYLLEYALKYSVVGKLGLLCEPGDMTTQTEELIQRIASKYDFTPQQQKTKAFNARFPLWKQAVPMRKYFLTTYGKRDWMVRKTLKYDLRYFHDADVDTLLPLDRGMLFWQKIIRQRINWKKMRFHGLDAVEACFEQALTNISPSPSLSRGEQYSVTLHCTDEPKPLLEERKWMDILERGASSSVSIINI